MALFASKAAVVATSDLYTLNPETAEATSIGATGHAFTALAFDPTSGVLYGATSNNSAATIRALYTLDPATGTATLIGQFKLGGTGSATPIGDLAFDSTGQLWGWSGTTGQIHQIDKATGAYTSPLGSTAIGVPAAAIGFAADDTLYYLVRHSGTENRLYTVAMPPPTGGTLTLVGTLTPSGTGFYPSSASFDEDGLLWWMNGGQEGEFVRLRTLSTLAWEVIGAASDPGDNFDGLAWGDDLPDEADPSGVGIVFSFSEQVIEPAEWTRVDDPSGI
jgi:hypothetical protein